MNTPIFQCVAVVKLGPISVYGTKLALNTGIGTVYGTV